MKILADENIVNVRELFSQIGRVEVLPAHQISAATVQGIDVLVIRSVTEVGPELLADTRVKFVGTATSGYDHVDTGYLERHDIGFAYAPGSNANSVAEYVLSALMVLSEKGVTELKKQTVGIVGCGHVGSALLVKLRALGVTCLVHDPPLKEKTGDSMFVERDEALTTDIVTLHVPLEFRGRHPTYQLVDGDFLAHMKDHSLLINTSRGAVVNEAALKWSLQEGRISAVLDVWQNEPLVDLDLLSLAALATPHIAGYSHDGKLRGTEMIYEAVCRYFELPLSAMTDENDPPTVVRTLSFSGEVSEDSIVRDSVLASYDIREDDQAFRKILEVSPDERADFFRASRKRYRIRHEFCRTRVFLPPQMSRVGAVLTVLGFDVRYGADPTTPA